MVTASGDRSTGEQTGDPGDFKALLLKISMRCVHVRPDQVDNEVDDGLRRICEFLDIQRSALWQ